MVAPVEEHKASDILSDRESEILKLVAMGMSNKEIAEKLFLSERTVKAHLTNIFNKLNVASRSEAIVKGLQWRLVTLGSTEDMPQAEKPALLIIIVLFVFLTISISPRFCLTYLGLMNLAPAVLELSRHSLERFLYLLLMLYAGWTLGLVAGTAYGYQALWQCWFVLSDFPDSGMHYWKRLCTCRRCSRYCTDSNLSPDQTATREDRKTVKDMKLARQDYESCYQRSDAIWVHSRTASSLWLTKLVKSSPLSVSELPGKDVRDFLLRRHCT